MNNENINKPTLVFTALLVAVIYFMHKGRK